MQQPRESESPERERERERELRVLRERELRVLRERAESSERRAESGTELSASIAFISFSVCCTVSDGLIWH